MTRTEVSPFAVALGLFGRGMAWMDCFVKCLRREEEFYDDGRHQEKSCALAHAREDYSTDQHATETARTIAEALPLLLCAPQRRWMLQFAEGQFLSAGRAQSVLRELPVTEAQRIASGGQFDQWRVTDQDRLIFEALCAVETHIRKASPAKRKVMLMFLPLLGMRDFTFCLGCNDGGTFGLTLAELLQAQAA